MREALTIFFRQKDIQNFQDGSTSKSVCPFGRNKIWQGSVHWEKIARRNRYYVPRERKSIIAHELPPRNHRDNILCAMAIKRIITRLDRTSSMAHAKHTAHKYT
jgi:hypothetical protein